MLCCIRRTKPVEKNDEADQEIKQDEKKPEDKAHKAATKIQASFRGHIIRKKMKDGEEEDEATPAVPEEEAKEAAEGEPEEDKKDDTPAATEQTAEGEAPGDQKEAETNQAKSPASEKPANSPAPVATSSVAAATSPAAAQPAALAPSSETPKEEAGVKTSGVLEKPGEVGDREVVGSPSTDRPENGVDSEDVQEESKQADVPATTVKETSDGGPNPSQDKHGAAEESQPADEVPAEALQESKDDQEKV